ISDAANQHAYNFFPTRRSSDLRKIPIVDASISEPTVMIVRLDFDPLGGVDSNFFGSVFACKLSCVNCAILASHPGFPSHQSTWRSEEHTSELQSRGHIVCRLLL